MDEYKHHLQEHEILIFRILVIGGTVITFLGFAWLLGYGFKNPELPSYIKPEFSEETKEQAAKVAEDFIKKSSNYVFDGSGLRRIVASRGLCRGCWNLVYLYDSEFDGYGDRSGEEPLPLKSVRRINISVEYSQVTYADVDDAWDLIKREYLVRSEADSLVRGEKGIFKLIELSPNRN